MFCLSTAPDLWTDAPVLSCVRPPVLASWERERRRRLDVTRIGATSAGAFSPNPLVDANVEAIVDVFIAGDAPIPCSVLSLDAQGVVRVRRDGDPILASLLDQMLLLPGYDYSERWMGTTAGGLALLEGVDVVLRPWEHLHPSLRCIDEAAALIVDPTIHQSVGALVVIAHESQGTGLLASLARSLAARVSSQLESEQSARSRLVMDQFNGRQHMEGAWVMGTDGDFVLTNALGRLLDASDRRVLREALFANFMLHDFGVRELLLPSGRTVSLRCEPVQVRDELIGAILVGVPATSALEARELEATRRQGAHVAPTIRRDYARAMMQSHAADDAQRERAMITANRDLMTPFRRAAQDVSLAVREGRSVLLVGEAGVGKRTLVTTQFRKFHPTGRVVRIDCAGVDGESEELVTAERMLRSDSDDRRQMLVLERLNMLTPATVRLIHDLLGQVPERVQLVATVDTTTIDASRPYGRLLGRFVETMHVPALRFRVEEIGDISLTVLRRLAGGRSVRMSHQVLRILEGYAWPGNIFELEDVVKFVLQRKPVGEIQPPDLPPVCFQGRSAKLSMLEAAQCEAIIQALYESRGNRYRAATMLGIARSTLYRKIDAFGISYIA